MKFLTFKGGIHPPHNKHFTSKIPIEKADCGSELVFPLSQHIGAPCEPIVAVGDHVYLGTKIADTDAFVSAPIHSSVSGEVIAIEPRLHPNGSKVMSIVIKNDGLDEKDPSITPKDPNNMSREDIIKTIREAGIVGMGGATFPTHIKLNPPADKKISYVIVNGAECEPYLTSDHRVMLEKPDDVLYGLSIVMKLFADSKGYIGIEDNKKNAIETISLKAMEYKNIEVKVLKTKYPQGSEKHLIKAITGKEVPSGGLPADVGVVVMNVDTAREIAKAFRKGVPVTRRIVTLSGSCVAIPKNFEVRMGTLFSTLYEQTGIAEKKPAKILMGGPMMGMAVIGNNVPAIKGTSAILFFDEKEADLPDETACIRCGKCVTGCPMNLQPFALASSANKLDYDRCEALNIVDCIECGSCSYVCPAKRQLVQGIRKAKPEVLARIRSRNSK